MKNILFIFLFLSSYVHAHESQKSIDQFFTHLATKNYEKTWDEAAPIFKATITKSQWAKSLTQVLTPLGKNKKREKIHHIEKTKLPGVADGKYIIYQFNSTYENKTEAVETITLKNVNNKWMLTGFYIR